MNANEEFEKLLDAFKETPQYKDDSFVWSDMAKYFHTMGYNAALDKAAEVAEDYAYEKRDDESAWKYIKDVILKLKEREK